MFFFPSSLGRSLFSWLKNPIRLKFRPEWHILCLVKKPLDAACKCRWNASRAFCVIHFERGTEVASCLNLLTFFCLQCSRRQSQPFNGTHRCWFSAVRKQRPCPPDPRYGRDNTFGRGDVLFTLSSLQVYPRLRNRSSDRFVRKAANDDDSSNRRWEAVSRLLGHYFFRRLIFFLIWKHFLFSLLGDKDRVVGGKAAQNSVPSVVSKLVLHDCRHQLC